MGVEMYVSAKFFRANLHLTAKFFQPNLHLTAKFGSKKDAGGWAGIVPRNGRVY